MCALQVALLLGSASTAAVGLDIISSSTDDTRIRTTPVELMVECVEHDDKPITPRPAVPSEADDPIAQRSRSRCSEEPTTGSSVSLERLMALLDESASAGERSGAPADVGAGTVGASASDGGGRPGGPASLAPPTLISAKDLFTNAKALGVDGSVQRAPHSSTQTPNMNPKLAQLATAIGRGDLEYGRYRLKAWQVLYCGGTQAIVDTLQRFSLEFDVAFKKEKFDW
jgi:hypothetical protein